MARCGWNCLGMNPDQLGDGEHGHVEPNFEGRQGYGGRTIWSTRQWQLRPP